MSSLISIIESHPATDLLIGGYFATAVVSALPDPHDPAPIGEKLYTFLFTLVHILGNSIPAKYKVPVASPQPPVVPPTV